MSDPAFKDLAEALRGFKRNAISEFIPPHLERLTEGAFYAGAQSALVLIMEALEITPDEANEKIHKVSSEIFVFFALARSLAKERAQEKEEKKTWEEVVDRREFLSACVCERNCWQSSTSSDQSCNAPTDIQSMALS
jgi:hypothetical protein